MLNVFKLKIKIKEKLIEYGKRILAFNYLNRFASNEEFKDQDFNNPERRISSPPILNFVQIKNKSLTGSIQIPKNTVNNIDLKDERKYKLFENFFMIGTNKSEIKKLEKENPDFSHSLLNPQYLYNYPKQDIEKLLFFNLK